MKLPVIIFLEFIRMAAIGLAGYTLGQWARAAGLLALVCVMVVPLPPARGDGSPVQYVVREK